MCLNKNAFDLFLNPFVFYMHNSLEKQTENSGVLLNWLHEVLQRFGILVVKIPLANTELRSATPFILAS